eukprot:TRINITY_DN65739_c6_g5_i2.p1 TRINITY_DN65739_c6_g5~~TRINITY_DN65739_c6_g5_i2.p1  ORF type:complete len:212 (-),score=113.73 TRINITY_DN65739_c6_g5_i2:165-761(-)
MSTLVETIKVMGEYMEALDQTAGADLILQSVQALRETKAIAARQETRVKEIVRDLTKRNDDMTMRLADPPAKKFVAQQHVVAASMQRVERDIAAIENRVRDEQGTLERVEGEHNALAAQKEAANEAALSDVPAAKSTLALYHSVSGITWDYDSKANVKGYVHLVDKDQVRAFEFKREAMRSRMEVANKLWDLMWENYA